MAANAEPLDKVVDVLVSDAIRIVEGTPLPPAPWVVALKKPRERPSHEQHAAYDAYVFPTPQWGLNINLASSYMGLQQAARIARLMVTNQTITTLDLSMCDLYSEGCETLVKCLRRNYVLKNLSLNGNRIGPRGAVALAEYLSMDGNHSRHRRDLHQDVGVGIAPLAFDGCEEVRPVYIPPHQGFGTAPKLTGISSDGPGSPSGKSADGGSPLNLGGTNRSGVGLGDTRRQRSTSNYGNTSRDSNSSSTVGGNNAHDDSSSPSRHQTSDQAGGGGAEAALYRDLAQFSADDDLGIAPPCYLKCPLESLSISYNAIGDEGTIAIMNALRENDTLAFINLRGNHITNLGGFAILDALADHYTLEEDMALMTEELRGKAKAAKKKGGGKKASPIQSPTAAKPRRMPTGPIRSCLPDRLRFDLDTLEVERLERIVINRRDEAAALASLSAPPPPREEGDPATTPAAASLSLAARSHAGGGATTASTTTTISNVPIIYESLFALLTNPQCPQLVTPTPKGADVAGPTAIAAAAAFSYKNNTAGNNHMLHNNTSTEEDGGGVGGGDEALGEQFGAVLEAFVKAKTGGTATVRGGRGEVGAGTSAGVDGTSAAATAPIRPQAVRAQERWSELMTAEQRYEWLAFNFPALFPYGGDAKGGIGKAVPHKGGGTLPPPATEYHANPILAAAARLLHDGNSTLDLSLLKRSQGQISPRAPPSAMGGTYADGTGGVGGARGDESKQIYTQKPHRAPTSVENAGGYFYPSVIRCQGRPESLTAPALLAAPDEVVYFTAPNGDPYTVSYTALDTTLRPSGIFRNASVLTAAASMQFLQATLVRAMGYNVAAAIAEGYSTSQGVLAKDSDGIVGAAEAGVADRLAQAAARAVEHDYHGTSSSLAMFGRGDRVVGEAYAKPPNAKPATRLTEAELADLDPFADEEHGGSEEASKVPPTATTTTEEVPATTPMKPRAPTVTSPSKFYRYSDHLPRHTAKPTPANTLPRALQPATPNPPAPTDPIAKTAIQLRAETARRAASPSSATHQAPGHPSLSDAPAESVLDEAPIPIDGVSPSQSPRPPTVLNATEAGNLSLGIGNLLPSPSTTMSPTSMSTLVANAGLPNVSVTVTAMSPAASTTAGRKRGGGTTESIVPTRELVMPPAWSLLPPELVFLEAMGYFGGKQQLNQMLSDRVTRQEHARRHGEADVDADMGGWLVTNTLAPHRKATGPSASLAPPVVPPYGHLRVPTYCHDSTFPNYKELVEGRSPSGSPTRGYGGSDGEEDDGKRGANRGAKGARDEERLLEMEGALPTDPASPRGGASAVPVPSINGRLQQLVKGDDPHAHNGVVLGSADTDAVAIDGANKASKRAYTAWTGESCALTAAVEVPTEGAGYAAEAKRRALPLSPSPPPGNAKAAAAGDGTVANGRYKYTPSIVGVKEARPAPIREGNSPTDAASAPPSLPPRLPMPEVSLRGIGEASLASVYGSLPVARVVQQWVGGRRDVRGADLVCPPEMLRQLRLSAEGVALGSGGSAAPAARRNSPPPGVSPSEAVVVPLPIEASPYLPLAETLLAMMRSPMYALVDPLTAFLRGRERPIKTGAAATNAISPYADQFPLSFPVALSAVNTPAAVATAMALSQREVLQTAANGIFGPPKNASAQPATRSAMKMRGRNDAAAPLSPQRSFASGGFGRNGSISGGLDEKQQGGNDLAGADATPGPNQPPAVLTSTLHKEAIRIVNQSAAYGAAIVSADTCDKVFAGTEPKDANVRPYPMLLTAEKLCDVALWECEQRAAANEAPVAAATSIYGEVQPPTPTYTGYAPVVAVPRNKGVESVWFESNYIDPLLGAAITMALQLRYRPKVPEGFNKKILKAVLSQREEEERRKINPAGR